MYVLMYTNKLISTATSSMKIVVMDSLLVNFLR
jgi:hypothetical protein